MTILLIGAKGQLGRELDLKGKALFGSDMTAMDLPEIDITDYSALADIFTRLAPSVVINASAYTAVDVAESQKELCFAVNRDGPAHLAKLCRKHQASLIHISTDYVFDGKAGRPYREDDPVSPIGVYGRSKAEGEKAVLTESGPHAVVRTSWLYGRYGNNFVKTMLRLAKQKDVIQVVSDQYGCPTSAADLAEAVLAMTDSVLKKKAFSHSVYHYCGEGITTWYDFAVAIFDISVRLGLKNIPAIKPITTAQFPTAAKRPAFSALDCSSIEKDFSIRLRPWRESLTRMLQDVVTSQER